jgi:hypothetical protein
MRVQRFGASVTPDPLGRAVIPIPFDPDEAWGAKAQHPAALAANPAAAAFFDTLAQFYRKAYLRWIDGTKRRPDLRAARIAEVVNLLEAGIKERPRAD